MECCELSNTIKRVEKQIGHSRTVLVGDLNMNPFEDGIISANGLHGVMNRFVAEKRTRTVQSKEYPFFYNPMWRFFYDNPPTPQGTYYCTRAEHKTFFWNIFDQVLIRPDLLPFFDNRNLAILHSDGCNSFLTSEGLPDNNVSDHLPMFFKINL